MLKMFQRLKEILYDDTVFICVLIDEVVWCGWCGCCGLCGLCGWRGWGVVGVGCVVGLVVVVVVVYLKRLRIVLRCAKAGCGRRTSSS